MAWNTVRRQDRSVQNPSRRDVATASAEVLKWEHSQCYTSRTMNTVPSVARRPPEIEREVAQPVQVVNMDCGRVLQLGWVAGSLLAPECTPDAG